MSANAALGFAPAAWKDWVGSGPAAIERCRRRVARRRVVKAIQQTSFSPTEKNILDEVVAFYSEDPHAFEGLASLVAERVIGSGCERRWVTKRSGDGGVDFVCRLDFGDRADLLSRTPVVVLGQAKCQKPDSPIGGKDLARLVARLQRGWVGVFVTTGHFSTSAQIELLEDKYPLVLINGKRLAQELHKIMVAERIELKEVLQQESRWYDTHVEPVEPIRVLDVDFSRIDLKADEVAR